MKDFDIVGRFMNPVVNRNGGVEQLAHLRTPGHRTADVRKPFQKLDVVQNGVAETLRSRWGVFPGVVQDLLKVR
jgi:hypothetical protein